MEPIIYFLGIFTGICLTILVLVFKNRKTVKMAGIMYVDVPNNLAKLHMNSVNISDQKIEKVILKVEHGVNLIDDESREEHIL